MESSATEKNKGHVSASLEEDDTWSFPSPLSILAGSEALSSEGYQPGTAASVRPQSAALSKERVFCHCEGCATGRYHESTVEAPYRPFHLFAVPQDVGDPCKCVHVLLPNYSLQAIQGHIDWYKGLNSFERKISDDVEASQKHLVDAKVAEWRRQMEGTKAGDRSPASTLSACETDSDAEPVNPRSPITFSRTSGQLAPFFLPIRSRAAPNPPPFDQAQKGHSSTATPDSSLLRGKVDRPETGTKRPMIGGVMFEKRSRRLAFDEGPNSK